MLFNDGGWHYMNSKAVYKVVVKLYKVVIKIILFIIMSVQQYHSVHQSSKIRKSVSKFLQNLKQLITN